MVIVRRSSLVPVLSLVALTGFLLLSGNEAIARAPGGGGGCRHSSRPVIARRKNAAKLVASAAVLGPRYSSKTVRQSGRSSAEVLSLPSEGDSAAAFSIRGGAGGATKNSLLVRGVAGAVAMALMEKGVFLFFQKTNVKFPAQLGGCIFLLTLLLLAEAVRPDLAHSLAGALSPGAALLAKWLPVFFVPGLIMLPLSPPIGNASEILKVLLVVVLGFLYSLSTTTAVVVFLRKAQGAITTTPQMPESPLQAGTRFKRIVRESSPPSAAATASPAKPFSAAAVRSFALAAAVSGVAWRVAVSSGSSPSMYTPLRTVFFLSCTFAAYVWGARLPAAVVKVIHPLVTTALLLLVLVRVVAKLTGEKSYLDVLRTYKVKSLSLDQAGAGDVLLYLLGPSVVSFAVSMYGRRKLIGDNLLVIAAAMLVSATGGLFGTAAFVRAIRLGGTGPSANLIRFSVLPRNVTTALAMALTTMLGGDISICAFVVVATAIVGATYGKSLLSAFGVKDPVSRGLGIGSSAQGLGVASIADEEDAFPFAAISMVLTAICATTLVSFPVVKETLISMATGSSSMSTTIGNTAKAAAETAAKAATTAAATAAKATS